MLLALARRGTASTSELAADTGLRWERVVAALLGWRKAYRRDYALVRVGTVQGNETAVGKVWRITPLGVQAAAALAKAMTRDPAVQGLSDLVVYFDAEPDPRP